MLALKIIRVGFSARDIVTICDAILAPPDH